MDGEVLLLRGEVESVIAGGGVGFFKGVAENILVAKFFVDGGVNFVEGRFLGDFEETPAGGFGQLLEYLLAIGT